MKTKNALYCCATFVVLCIFSSCKRTGLSEVSSTNEIQSAVTSWYTNFVKTSFGKGRLSAQRIIESLNYQDAAIIEQPNDEKIFLISTKGGENKKYFALKQSRHALQAMGIYDAKNSDQIKDFLKTNKMPIGEKLTINSLDGRLTVQWETKLSGQSVIRMAQSRQMMTKILNKEKQNSNISIKVASQMIKPSYIQDPEPGCTDWYWIEYDTATGMIYSVDYLYTTCEEGSGGGGGQTSNSQLSCELEVEDEINQDTYSLSELQNVSETESTPVTRKRAYPWKIYTGLTWHIKSHEIGEHQYSYSLGKWEWVSFTHSSTSFSGFWAGGNISCTVNSAVPSVYSQYAGMHLDYTVKFAFTCDDKPCEKYKNANSGILIEVNQTTN